MSAADAPPNDLDPTTRTALYKACYRDLPTFGDLVFSQSFGSNDEPGDEFTRGSWVRQRLEFLQSGNKTCDIGPRNHIKSTGFYAHAMWKIFRARFNAMPDAEWATGSARFEIHYFSYKQKSAGYHIGEGSDSIKNLIERNPYFNGIEDLKPTAETKAKYSWDDEHEITITPHGMLSHVRGIHSGLVYVDDPFQDPENDLNPTKVLKINNVFRAGVSSIPKTDDGEELHVTTTPQTTEDFTFDEELLENYEYMQQPAITDHATESVLWSEWMDYDALMARKRELGDKLFNQEFMCSPKSSEVAFFTDADVGAMVEPGLRDWGSGRQMTTAEGRCPDLRTWLDSAAVTGVVAGMDLGKKRHPSHLAVFAALRRWLPDENGDPAAEPASHLVQLHQQWMDEWDYSRQIDYCRRAIEFFGLKTLLFDHTNEVLEMWVESGSLPHGMEPVKLTGGTKDAMAGALDIYSSGDRLKLLDDGRQKRQLTVVTNDLDAVETNEGHGEPFTSIGLAAWQAQREHWESRVGSLEM
jgi:hypothetical protein